MENVIGEKNYCKMSSEEFYKETLQVLNKYEGRIEGVVSYSFAVRFSQRRSLNVVTEFAHYLVPVPIPSNSKKEIVEVLSELRKMCVFDFNDGNITFN